MDKPTNMFVYKDCTERTRAETEAAVTSQSGQSGSGLITGFTQFGLLSFSLAQILNPKLTLSLSEKAHYWPCEE